MYRCRCEQIETEEAVWGGKEGNTYPGGDRMGGESQNHSPHYHFLHYAETDPLTDHTQGQTRSRAHQRSVYQGWSMQGGGVGRKHTGAQHTKHTNSCANTVSSALKRVMSGF